MLYRRDVIKSLLAISASGALAACVQGGDNSKAKPSAEGASELSSANLVTLTALVDTIIPATDTGGALAAGVPATLASLVKDWGDDKFVAYWTGGLNALAKTLNGKAGQSFANLSTKQRENLLAKYDAEVFDGTVKDDFYKDMKHTAATAYYMSEIGATEELAYEPVPGEWIGCVPLSDFPKSWAT